MGDGTISLLAAVPREKGSCLISKQDSGPNKKGRIYLPDYLGHLGNGTISLSDAVPWEKGPCLISE